MSASPRDTRELNFALCKKLQPFLEPLAPQFGIQTFGYRKFYPDGKSFAISTNFDLMSLFIEKYTHKIIPNLEKEVSLVLNNGRSHFFRFGKPDKDNPYLCSIYDVNIWNALSYYRKSGNCVEAFHFASTRENEVILDEYINNIQAFEMFSFYIKDKINSTFPASDFDLIKTETISPLVFKKKSPPVSQNPCDFKSIIASMPLQKFFLSHNEQDHCLSIQEFKCLSLLSRGKTTKEVGVLLNISSRTVEGYIENIKNKINVASRSQLIDLFIANFKNDKNYIFQIEDEYLDN